jgi:hypothetical protein
MMPKHRYAALFISPMLKHHCAVLFISPMSKHRRRTLVTVFPTPRHLCSTLFTSSQSQKHPIPHYSHSRNNSVQHLFRFFPPPSTATPFAATFSVAETPTTFHSPVAETPIVSNFSSVSPDAETSLFSILFIPFPSSFSPPSSTKQFRPAIVSPLLLLKHLLPATLHHFIHDAETPSFSTL